MQITSSTIGNLYSATLSSRATTPSGNRLTDSSAQSGMDSVTLSNEARALADAEKTATDPAASLGTADDNEITTKAEAAHDVKLERRTEERVALMGMVMQGISMMCHKRSPALMRETLKSFMAQYHDEINDGRQGKTADAVHKGN